MPDEIDVPIRDPERFRGVLSAERFEEFRRGVEEARMLLDGRAVWNVNSTARGGGVVELLRPLLGYARGVGVDARWLVIDGSPAFYEVTKRIHNRLHGFEGDGGLLDEEARRIYEETLAENTAAFAERVRPGDVGDRGLRHRAPGTRRSSRRRPCHRLHGRRLHQGRAVLRRRLRRGRQELVRALQATAEGKRDLPLN